MSLLSLENEDQPSILERNGFLYNKKENNKQPLQELEEAIKESTSDLPVGKAIHLLLHVHGQVLDKAIKSLKESTPNEHILLKGDSPTIRAILSLEHYLAVDNIHERFMHLYNPLKEKILKKNTSETALRLMCYFLLYSSYKTQIQQFFIKELDSTDKRSQLATVIILQYLYDNYLQKEDEPHFSQLFISHLLNITNTTTPTVLACTACEAAIHLFKYALEHNNDTPTSKIVQVDIPENNLESQYKSMDTILNNLETWQKNKSVLEIEAFKELHRLIHLSDFKYVLSFILPKKILSPKPLSVKKQDEIIDATNISSNTKMIILALLQKGQWIEKYSKSVAVLSTEEERIKRSLAKLFRDMDFDAPGGKLVPVIAIELPDLCSLDHIKDLDAIHAIMDRVDDTSDATLERLKPLVQNQPESCIGQLLFHVVQQDNRAKFAFEFLSFLISKEPDQIVPLLQTNLLSVVKSSNEACELLIKCMAHTDLVLLIKKLVKLVFTAQDQGRERTIYIALISKALLEPHWASDSPMIYLDLIRELKAKKKLIFTESQGFEQMKILNPHSLTSYQNSETVEFPIEESVINAVCPVLIESLQLWSSKVDLQSLQIAIKQLVQYSYGIPTDNICLDAWKNLSFTFLNNHQLIWYIIEPCLNIMKTQLTFTDELLEDTSTQANKFKESILYLRLNPMLTLQTIPKETYDVVQIPSSYLNTKQKKLESLGIDPKSIRICSKSDQYSKISVELMDELLQRCFETKQMGDKLETFSISLLSKIFCI